MEIVELVFPVWEWFNKGVKKGCEEMFKKSLIKITNEVFQDKQEIIKFMAHLDNADVIDSSNYANDVMERESVVPTYVGYGIAIPHARSNAIKNPFVIYVKLEHSIPWGEVDEQVDQVFMLGVPKDNTDQKNDARLHLKILSELSKNLMRTEFRKELAQAKDETSIFRILETIEEGMSL